MSFKKSVGLFFFIAVIISALYLNIYLMKSKKLPEMEFLHLKGIYLDLSLVENKDQVKKIKEFINSKNDELFSSLIFQTDDPIGQFYGFCGFLNSNQKNAMKYLDKLLSSSKKVNIIISEDNKKNNFPLGYAFLMLVKYMPKELVSVNEKEFSKTLDASLVSAYKSALTRSNSDFKRDLTSYITDKNPDLLNNLTVAAKESTLKKSVKDMSNSEKIELSFLLHTLSKDDRSSAIKVFLTDSNDQLVKNTLNALNEDDSRDIAELVNDLITKKRSPEITKIAVEKYSAILKEKSLSDIKNLLGSETNSDVVKASLEQIKKYGNDSYYDFLKIFLDTKYPASVNLVALDTIIKTSYRSRPNDVINTMIYILKKADEPLAEQAVRFYIDSRIQDTNNVVIPRLKLRESERMEKAALDYIGFFKATSAASILKELVASGKSDEIKKKAQELISKLGIREED